MPIQPFLELAAIFGLFIWGCASSNASDIDVTSSCKRSPQLRLSTGIFAVASTRLCPFLHFHHRYDRHLRCHLGMGFIK
jgi:hypothetical protein